MTPNQVNILVTLIGAGAGLTTDGTNYILPNGEVIAPADVNDALLALHLLLTSTQSALTDAPNVGALTPLLQALQSI
jgi:hypothetical protein